MATVPTKYWHTLNDGRVQCDVCPRHCRMHEGQRGLCYVRGVQYGEVVLTSWGEASGFCIDAIEKKPLNHFLPGTPILSFGQFGCNLTCSFCQNHSISKAVRDSPAKHGLGLISGDPGYEEKQKDWAKHQHTGQKQEKHTGLVDVEKKHTNVNHAHSKHTGDLSTKKHTSTEQQKLTTRTQQGIEGGSVNGNNGLGGCNFSQNHDISKSREFDKLQSQASPEMIAEAAVKSGCRSVAYTYNDPVIFLEYAVDVAKACHERGIKNVAVSAGYICEEPRAEFFQHMDAANIDLKAFTQEFYRKLCSADLAVVLETLKYLKHETDVWFEITDLLIPDENDSEHEIEEMTQWVMENLGPDVPIHFTAFHPDWKMLDKERTPPDTLIRARNIALKNGLRYVYTGNIHHKPTQSTYCHNCDHMLIGRDWHELSDWNLDFGGNHLSDCRNCGSQLAGVFEEKPGDWGRKRVPLKFRTPQSNSAMTSQ